MLRPLKAFLFCLMLNISTTTGYRDEMTILDIFTPILRTVKSFTFNGIENNLKNGRTQMLLKLARKVQNVPVDMKFPCNLNMTLRSKSIPNSVHQLRPGDIDVIGAMGDSLTAGNGALATNLLEVIHEGRGSVFSIGGQETWRTHLTLPNILKMFNPDIYGYSLNSISTDRKSRFNVGEPGAISGNMPYMAKVLVKRIKSDKRVNLEKDWKIYVF